MRGPVPLFIYGLDGDLDQIRLPDSLCEEVHLILVSVSLRLQGKGQKRRGNAPEAGLCIPAGSSRRETEKSRCDPVAQPAPRRNIPAGKVTHTEHQDRPGSIAPGIVIQDSPGNSQDILGKVLSVGVRRHDMDIRSKALHCLPDARPDRGSLAPVHFMMDDTAAHCLGCIEEGSVLFLSPVIYDNDTVDLCRLC